ncbi:hypothetical protein H2203_002692 [Taxawa tesnikishii (nom. ined.)]|nr:hypothetical protein H2203_002692 [Dothideales sp. JES 119]
MRCYIQVLTTPTADTPGTTLLLHFDNKRYLIGNVSEGTQRAAVQQGARLLKVSGIFLTGRTEWDKNGGLIGMILTLADAASASSAAAKDELRKKIIIKARRQKKSLLRKTSMLRWRRKRKKGLGYANSASTGQKDGAHKQWYRQSPKAGFDELNGKTPTATAEVVPAQDLTEKDKTVMTAKAVVSEMFDSAWRLDALFETPINQVKLPATLFVRNPDTNKIEKYEGPMPDGSREVPDINVLVRRPWPGALVETLPSTEPATEAVSYIFRNHYQRGKFRPERALELGVEKGIKWTRLSDGESVENAKGRLSRLIWF